MRPVAKTHHDIATTPTMGSTVPLLAPQPPMPDKRGIFGTAVFQSTLDYTRYTEDHSCDTYNRPNRNRSIVTPRRTQYKFCANDDHQNSTLSAQWRTLLPISLPPPLQRLLSFPNSMGDPPMPSNPSERDHSRHRGPPAAAIVNRFRVPRRSLSTATY